MIFRMIDIRIETDDFFLFFYHFYQGIFDNLFHLILHFQGFSSIPIHTIKSNGAILSPLHGIQMLSIQNKTLLNIYMKDEIEWHEKHCIIAETRLRALNKVSMG